jgi:large subunit ribosomal protein L10
MDRTQKADLVKGIKEQLGRMTSAVFLDFSGMNVEEVSQLRASFRAKGVSYRVIKNTLMQKAVADQPFASALAPALRGMTGVAWSFEEPSAAARVVRDFRKENEKLKIKAALLDGQVLAGAAVESQLATLPSKDEARARLLATMMAPAQRLVMVLNAPARNLVGTLAARQRQKEEA